MLNFTVIFAGTGNERHISELAVLPPLVVDRPRVSSVHRRVCLGALGAEETLTVTGHVVKGETVEFRLRYTRCLAILRRHAPEGFGVVPE